MHKNAERAITVINEIAFSRGTHCLSSFTICTPRLPSDLSDSEVRSGKQHLLAVSISCSVSLLQSSTQTKPSIHLCYPSLPFQHSIIHTRSGFSLSLLLSIAPNPQTLPLSSPLLARSIIPESKPNILNSRHFRDLAFQVKHLL